MEGGLSPHPGHWDPPTNQAQDIVTSIGPVYVRTGPLANGHVNLNVCSSISSCRVFSEVAQIRTNCINIGFTAVMYEKRSIHSSRHDHIR